MKIRTIYLKVADMDRAVTFWTTLLSREAHKSGPYWSEFACGNVNLGLLLMEDFSVAKDASNAVPVFELPGEVEVEEKVRLATSIGATIVVPKERHPDKKSYVMADVAGNEFELTSFRD